MAKVLDEAERKVKLAPLLKTGWCKVDGRDAIEKKFQFGDFNEAFGFMTRVAMKAEQMTHHPEWFNFYHKVDVTLITYNANGLTDNDITMATFMDEISGKKKS